MGLDMYLKRGKREDVEKWREIPKSMFEELDRDQFDAVYPWKEVGYWRKANMIRQWFVEKCDYPVNEDCYEFELTKEDIENLLDDCLKILNAEPSIRERLAEEIMPTASGFFFGGTEYDEYYYDYLHQTVDICREVLENTDWDNEVVIYYEWW